MPGLSLHPVTKHQVHQLAFVTSSAKVNYVKEERLPGRERNDVVKAAMRKVTFPRPVSATPDACAISQLGVLF